MSCDNTDCPTTVQYSLKYMDDHIVYNNGNHAAFTGMVEYSIYTWHFVRALDMSPLMKMIMARLPL